MDATVWIDMIQFRTTNGMDIYSSTFFSATIVVSSQPNPNSYREFTTTIEYSCPQRLNYFDYPVGSPFVSYFYTTNINSINITCNKDGYDLSASVAWIPSNCCLGQTGTH